MTNCMIVRIDDELYHHGIKGQKWGIRRYQNEDGSLTAEGRERYGVAHPSALTTIINNTMDAGKITIKKKGCRSWKRKK